MLNFSKSNYKVNLILMIDSFNDILMLVELAKTQGFQYPVKHKC